MNKLIFKQLFELQDSETGNDHLYEISLWNDGTIGSQEFSLTGDPIADMFVINPDEFRLMVGVFDKAGFLRHDEQNVIKDNAIVFIGDTENV